MRESYVEGLATHDGPESCAAAREGRGEALTGARTGWVWSRVIHETLRGADALEVGGRRNHRRRPGETPEDPARSKTPCTSGITLHGNREVPRSSARKGRAERIGKPQGRRR